MEKVISGSLTSVRLRTAKSEEFESVRNFYWELIDLMKDQSDTVGWKKGIYPTDQFLMDSIESGELYVLEQEGCYFASVILNNAWNEGYEGLPWSIACSREEVMVPHALAVHPHLHGQGIGSAVVKEMIRLAKECGKKTIRLDLLTGNTAAEHLYTDHGFLFVEEKTMFYEDTGWTQYTMYELVL